MICFSYQMKRINKMSRSSQLLFSVLIQSILVSCAFYPQCQLLSLLGLPWFLATVHSLRGHRTILSIYVSGFAFFILTLSFHWVGFAIAEYYSTTHLVSFLILLPLYLLFSLTLYIPLTLASGYLTSFIYKRPTTLLISFVILNIALIMLLPIPPLLLGYGFISTVFNGFYLSSFIGVKGLTIIFWLLSFLLALFIISKKWSLLLSSVAVLTCLHLLGSLALSSIKNKEHEVAPLLVHLLQPNISNQLKRTDISGASKAFEIMGKNYELMDKVLQNGASSSAARMFILPETAIPYYFPTDTYYFDAFKKYLADSQIALLSGGYWKTSSTHHNSAFFFNEADKKPFTEQSIYHKQILLPFGEYIPGKQLVSWLNTSQLDIPDFNPGKNRRIWHFKNFTFSPFICYEVLFDSLWLTTHNIDFIYNPTNDAWFGPTIQQYQHLTVVWTKSLEFGIPVLRAANSGYSAWITPSGVKHQSPLNQENIETFTIRSTFEKSFYYKNYTLVMFSELFLLLVVLLLLHTKKMKQTSRPARHKVPAHPDSSHTMAPKVSEK